MPSTLDPVPAPDEKPAPAGGQLGLRARITFAFTLGALAIALLIGISTLLLTRRGLLDDRERRSAVRVTADARFLDQQLSRRESIDDPTTLLESLRSVGDRILMVNPPDPGGSTDGPREYATGDLHTADIPDSLRTRVMWDREPALMRTAPAGRAVLIVGTPIQSRNGAYFEFVDLSDIGETLRTLGVVLLITGSVTTLAGAGLGWWASRRALRPLALVGDAAARIAAGHLETRLDAADYAEDPDLGPLVSSFNGMVQALQDRIDRDARFASDVSHELRSPLTTLTAAVQVLGNARDELPDRACTAVNLLTEEMAHFGQLVEDLLEISRFDAGAVRLDLSEVRLADLVRATIAEQRSPGSEPKLSVAPEVESLVLECDKVRVVQILSNLLDNARKYAGGATSVQVTVADGYASVAVEDSGPGVPPEERLRIFERFNRGSFGGSRSTATGVGLGLALVAEHTRIQNGRIRVEDRPDGEEGARFVLDLPLHREAAPNAAQETALEELW